MKKIIMFKRTLIIFVILKSSISLAQEGRIINHIYKGNEESNIENYNEAETEYRKALSLAPEKTGALYNLGNAHYKDENFDEASQRFFQTQKFSNDKLEKHMAFHNMGNIFMQKKEYVKAVEMYKNALRNNPKDDETRYNYALAKELLEKEKQQEKNQENNDDSDKKEEQNKDQNKKNDDSDKKNDKENNDQSEEKSDKNDDKKNEDKSEKKKEDNNKNTSPSNNPGQLSPDQVKSLLEAMNNIEKDVQKKINAKKVKGSPVRGRKDW